VSDKAIIKMINLPKILEAAKFLESMGLGNKEMSPEQYVKKYVSENPEINVFLRAEWRSNR
jgi:hypothetical protein